MNNTRTAKIFSLLDSSKEKENKSDENALDKDFEPWRESLQLINPLQTQVNSCTPVNNNINVIQSAFDDTELASNNIVGPSEIESMSNAVAFKISMNLRENDITDLQPLDCNYGNDITNVTAESSVTFEDQSSHNDTDILEDEDPYNDNSDNDKDYVPNNADMSSDNEAEKTSSNQKSDKCKSRWKESRPETWKRNKNRILKNKCFPYDNYKGVRQPGKSPKTVNCTNCKYSCTTKFSEEERKVICQKYWMLPIYERKKDFILQNILSCSPSSRRPRKENALQRKNAKRYFFTKNEEKIQVCQFFFMKTLNISNRVILTAFMGKDELGHFSGGDKRGRKTPSNKTSDDVVAKVKAHIESFPYMESHYTRKSSSRKYLDSSLNISKMYSLYKIQCQQQEDQEVVSLITYRRIFCKDYNLSFFHPKKDQCLTCITYLQSTPEGKVEMEEDYQNHMRRKKEAQEEKLADKQRAKVDKSFMSVTFDLQSVLQIPSTAASIAYYLRKLNMYNLTVYEAGIPNRAFCFCWTEVNGRRGSCEIGTCLIKYIQNLPPEVKEISFFSDTCGGQNRNVQISALFLNLVQKTHLEVIEQKFLESGHSFMEVDSMHSAIEQQKRFIPVYCVNDWINIFKLARSTRGRNKNKPPYITQEIKFDEFLDLKQMSATLVKNRNLDENGERVNWLKVKCFKYEKAKPNIIQYKYDYNSPYKSINVGAKRRGRRSTSNFIEIEDLPRLYSEQLKISHDKKMNLLTMCQKKVIPEIFHYWINSLPSDKGIKDVLPEADMYDSEVEEEII